MVTINWEVAGSGCETTLCQIDWNSATADFIRIICVPDEQGGVVDLTIEIYIGMGEMPYKSITEFEKAIRFAKKTYRELIRRYNIKDECDMNTGHLIKLIRTDYAKNVEASRKDKD